jgi:hypothetical protein
MGNARLVGAVILAGWAYMAGEKGAEADATQSPAMFARFNNYNATDPRLGNASLCFNVPEGMPAGRQSRCSVSLVRTGVGASTITVTNGKPFPAFFDVGYSVFVTSVGGNALCREVSGRVPTGTNNFESKVQCVTPAGAAVDTPISWVYRADSFSYPQYGFHNQNFAYARFNRANVSQPVADESFNSYDPAGLSITNQRLAVGQYRVTFIGANFGSSDGISAFGLNNVQTAPTCTADNTTECRRSLCRIASQSMTANNVVVDVRCGYNGTARDTDFRIFMGGESHTSQVRANETVSVLRGEQFGWANVPTISTAGACKETNSFTHFNQHTDPYDSPGRDLRVCRRSQGVYRVDFRAHGGLYHRDSVSAILTASTGNTYCNLGAVQCGDSQCASGNNEPVYIDAFCYSGSGSATDTSFNLSMTYD